MIKNIKIDEEDLPKFNKESYIDYYDRIIKKCFILGIKPIDYLLKYYTYFIMGQECSENRYDKIKKI